MKRLIRGLLFGFALLLVLPAVVAAHPLGNFTVNRYSRIELGPDEARLRYVLDLAEIPTLQELRAASPSGTLNEALRQRLLDAKVKELTAGARLTIDGAPVSWSVESASLDLLSGQADLDTLRIALTLGAPVRITEGARVEYQDTNYPGRIGWHEVVLRGAGGVALRDTTVPAIDETDELRNYPTDPSRPPLDVSTARAAVTFSAVSDGGRARVEAVRRLAAVWTPLDRVPAELTAFIRGETASSPIALLAALAVAAALGAMHGLGPGHGKTLVAAYLIGSRGTPRHAALLGLTVTLTHTLGVYALGFVTLAAARFIVPETLYPVITLVSGLMVVAIGVSLVRSRLRGQNSHGHTHGHALALPHAGGREDHLHPHEHHHHDEHEHEHDGHHHHHGHSHEVPERARNALMPRSLVMLGVSGGILPCPTALVLLLAAISFHNIPLGMLLVVAFSVGLAGILTAIGLLVVFGGRALGRMQLGVRLAGSRRARLLPAFSAMAITLWGLAITAQAALSFL